MRDCEVEIDFPDLFARGYRVTSEASDAPNCIGWALYDRNHFWDPDWVGVRGYYWPPSVARDDSVQSWVGVFRLHGYETCEDVILEPDTVKIAIYSKDNVQAAHVARQLKSGKWTSKLGTGVDIEHDIVDGLGGNYYGKVVQVMKRTRYPGDD